MTEERQVCRWAALSLSTIASTFFQDLLGRSSSQFNHKLVAISTTKSPDQAKQWLKDNKVPDISDITVHRSWEEMLEKGTFDIVYISTPHPLHYDMILKAVSCKRHVLVEKPATMNASQFRQCIDLAAKHEVVLMEAMWTRYLPATKYFVEDLLPRIGEVRRVFSEFSFPIVSEDLGNDSRFLDKNAGAGALLDQGVYALTWVDLALNSNVEGNEKTNGEASVNGTKSSTSTNGSSTDVRVVHANSHPVPNRPNQIDDINTIVLASPSTTAIVSTSMTLPGSNQTPFYKRLAAHKAAPAVRIEGTEASVAIPFPCIRPEELHVQWYGKQHLNEDGTEKDEVIRKPAEGWGIWYQADVIAEVVLSGKQPRPGTIGGEETLRVLGWMDTARELAGIEYDGKLDEVKTDVS